MTPQERAVIEAARAFFDAWDTGQSTLSRISNLGVSLRALSAIPADPQAQGEAMELEIALWVHSDGNLFQCVAGSDLDKDCSYWGGWTRLGTVRLPLIPASVEGK